MLLPKLSLLYPLTLSPYLIFAGLALGRFMDLYSTYYVSPDLSYEENPIYRKIGWRGGILMNVLIVIFLPLTIPYLAVVLAVTSLLVSVHNTRLGLTCRIVGGADFYQVIVGKMYRYHPLRESLQPWLMEFSATCVLASGFFALVKTCPDLRPVGMGFVLYGITNLYVMSRIFMVWADQKLTEREAAKEAGITL